MHQLPEQILNLVHKGMDTGKMNISFLKWILPLKLQNSSTPIQTITIILFLFDQSFGHCMLSDNTQIAHKMNVSEGSKQSFLQDTMWDGKPQKMDIKWFTKSLKTALALKEVVLLLQKWIRKKRNFKFQKTQVEGSSLSLSKGHRVMLIPKFHCEINPTEHV